MFVTMSRWCSHTVDDTQTANYCFSDAIDLAVALSGLLV